MVLKTTDGKQTINEISNFLDKKIGIVFHEDLDGIIGGVCIKILLKSLDMDLEKNVTYIPTQYSKEQILNFEKMVNFDFLLFIDFCPSVMEIIELFENGNQNIHIFDHHFTQMMKISDNDKKENSLSKKYSGFKYYFNNTKAGCGIAFDEFVTNIKIKDDILTSDAFRNISFASNYAEDRDLWKWELINSKEINAGFDIIMNVLEIKHDLDEWYNLFNGIEPKKFNNLKEIYPEIDFNNLLKNHQKFCKGVFELGLSKVRYDNAYINKIVRSAEKGKIPKINIGGIEMFVLNNSNLISEVGNALTVFDYPSCQWFVIHEIKDGLLKEPELVLSFRSTDDLPDVSIAAAALGGGGHRNACGASLSINKLPDLLSGNL